MNYDAKNELLQVQSNLRKIISELRNISDSLRTQFSGIGSEHCAKSIQFVVENYERILRKLEKVNLDTLLDENADNN